MASIVSGGLVVTLAGRVARIRRSRGFEGALCQRSRQRERPRGAHALQSRRTEARALRDHAGSAGTRPLVPVAGRVAAAHARSLGADAQEGSQTLLALELSAVGARVAPDTQRRRGRGLALSRKRPEGLVAVRQRPRVEGGHLHPDCAANRLPLLLRPKVAREWHHEKNGALTARGVTVMSNRRVWRVVGLQPGALLPGCRGRVEPAAQSRACSGCRPPRPASTRVVAVRARPRVARVDSRAHAAWIGLRQVLAESSRDGARHLGGDASRDRERMVHRAQWRADAA